MPPIATPFINDEVAYDKLAQNFSKWNKTGLSGYVVMGSNGESRAPLPILSESDKQQLKQILVNSGLLI